MMLKLSSPIRGSMTVYGSETAKQDKCIYVYKCTDMMYMYMYVTVHVGVLCVCGCLYIHVHAHVHVCVSMYD